MDELSKQMEGLELNTISSREKQTKLRKIAVESARLQRLANAEASKKKKNANAAERATRRAKRSGATGNTVPNVSVPSNSGRQSVKGASTRKAPDQLKKKVRDLTTELAAVRRELTKLEKSYKEAALAAFEAEGDAEKKAAATAAKSALAAAKAKEDTLKSDLAKAKAAAGVPANKRMNTIQEENS